MVPAMAEASAVVDREAAQVAAVSAVVRREAAQVVEDSAVVDREAAQVAAVSAVVGREAVQVAEVSEVMLAVVVRPEAAQVAAVSAALADLVEETHLGADSAGARAVPVVSAVAAHLEVAVDSVVAEVVQVGLVEEIRRVAALADSVAAADSVVDRTVADQRRAAASSTVFWECRRTKG